MCSLFVAHPAGWQSGYAAACKAVYAGSIPTPASNHSATDVLHLLQVCAVPLGLHVVAVDEAQRGGVDAVAQPAAVLGPVVEDVAEVAVAVRRADLRADHPVRGVPQLVDVRGLDGL